MKALGHRIVLKLRQGVRAFLRHLGFAYFRLVIRGTEQIPASGPAILAGNHPNVLDGILLLIVSPRPVRFLVTEEMFFHPLLHWSFVLMDCIPVYRSRSHNGDALRAAVEALERGDVIGIFPEGTTADRGRVREIRRGVGLLALKTGAPVVPFGVAGSYELFPPERKVPRPGTIAMSFGRPQRLPVCSREVVPEAELTAALGGIRSAILTEAASAEAVPATFVPPWWKRLQIAAASLLVVPMSGALTLTAPPNLEPAARHG